MQSGPGNGGVGLPPRSRAETKQPFERLQSALVEPARCFKIHGSRNPTEVGDAEGVLAYRRNPLEVGALHLQVPVGTLDANWFSKISRVEFY